MILYRKFLFVASFLLWSLMSMGQSADFEIRNFHERTTDLSAISSNYKDLNKLPAALIRFTVRDPEFEFSSNWGILGIERKTGEVYLYVPQDTKRLTIRHPRLGVLQDYEIPVRIQSKVTYGADIVITEKARPKQEPQQVVSKAPVTAPSNQPQLQPQSVSPKGKTKSDFHFYAGVGLNAVSLMGPSFKLGIRNKMFSVEGGFAYGMDKVEDVRLSFSSTVNEAYDYSCMKAWARLGVNFDTEKFRITPQAGVTFNMISGKTASGTSSTTDYFKDANPMSILAAVRLSYEVADHLRVHLTPQYDFSLGGDQIYEVIKQGDSKLKAWGEGFGINAGVIYEF